MATIDGVTVELSAVLGSATMPVHQLLRMGRGAVIALDRHESEPVQLLANNTPVAVGQVLVEGDKISLAITRMLPPRPR